MTFSVDITTIDRQIEALFLSYQRQQNLVGKHGYDPQLMHSLKKDLAFLESEKSRLTRQYHFMAREH